MKTPSFVSTLLVCLGILSCTSATSSNPPQPVAAYGAAAWARTLTAGTSQAIFYGMTNDGSGNSYAVGYLFGNQTFGFGNGITVTGMVSNNYNPVIVKYDGSGVPQWAKTLATGANQSYFHAVTGDSSGNTYVVGYMDGTGNYNFGSGDFAGTSSENTVIVKYNSAGTAQWARTITAGTNQVSFIGVALDSSSNAYAVGNIYSLGSVSFASGISAPGFTGASAPVIVKYSSLGTVQWATAMVAVPASAYFYGVAVDASGNTYGVGFIYPGTFDFGNGVTASGTASSGNSNTVIVKYDSSGKAQWARTLTAGTAGAYFNGVAVDTTGNAYAVGTTKGTGTYGFGNGITATGTASDGNGSSNTVIVKYSSVGSAQWAKTLTAGTGGAWFKSVSVDSAGNTYVVGSTTGAETFGFGDGITVIGTASGTNTNTVVVKYNSSGTAQWAQTLTSGTAGASFEAVSNDASGNLYAAGSIAGTETYGFGNGVAAAGTSTGNVLIVKYTSH